MGEAAARDIKAKIAELLAGKQGINMIFAAAPSQNDSHPRSPSQTVESKTAVPPMVIRLFWSRRRGLNPRPQRPEVSCIDFLCNFG